MRSFRFAVIFLSLSTAAYATDAEPAPAAPKPTCGKTAEDCQKVVDTMAAQIQRQGLTIQALIAQRNNVRAAADNAEIEAFVAQQGAQKAPAAAPAK